MHNKIIEKHLMILSMINTNKNDFINCENLLN